MKNNGKMRSRIKLLLAILIILLAGAGSAYTNKAALINSYYRVMKSPKEYYIYLEKYGLYELVSSFPEVMTDKKDTYAYDISSNITFHRNELDSILNTVLGTNLTLLEKRLGIPINNFGLDILLASKSHMLNETIGITLNNSKLLTTELFLDSAAQRVSLRFPELSDAYLTKSLEDGKGTINMLELQQKLLDTDLPEQILRRYMDLYFNRLGTVTLDEKVPLSLENTVTECNLLTVTFTQKEIRELYFALLETAKSDEDILSLLPLLNITQEQYLRSFDKFGEIISSRYFEGDQKSILQLRLYVDHKGRILSREMITFGKTTLGYTFLKKEDYLEYELHLTQASTNRELRINGTNRKLEEGNHGDIILFTKNLCHSSDSDVNIDISYEDVRRVNHEGKHYLEGSFTLSSNKLTGILITSAFSYKDSLQLNATAIRLGASPLIEINSNGMPMTDYEVIQPTDSLPRYDLSEYDKYLSAIDFEAYLTSLSNALGINQNALHDLLW